MFNIVQHCSTMFNRLIVKFFIRAVYKKQNEFQFHTSKHYFDHRISIDSIDTKFSSIWTNKSVEVYSSVCVNQVDWPQVLSVKTWELLVHLVSVALTLDHKTVSVYLQHLPQQQTASVVTQRWTDKTVSVYLQQPRHHYPNSHR